jgi:membrane protein YdbS with pleckstrin-like domain
MPNGNPTLDGGDWLRPSPRLTSLRRAEVAAATALIAVATGVAAGVLVSPAAGLGAAVAAAILGAVAGVIVRRRVATWGYREREDDLLVRRGLLVSRLSVVPYGRMQFVDVTAGPLERRFGLVTVRLYTAAAASDARIPGLPAETGTLLRDRLAALGEAQASGL